MALTQQRKDEITADMTRYLAAEGEATTVNVMTLAWAYKCHSNEITPLVRQWLKAGLIVQAYVGMTNAKNYRAGHGQLASLLESAKAGDSLAYAAAIDYLLEKGTHPDRKDAEVRVKILLGK